MSALDVGLGVEVQRESSESVAAHATAVTELPAVITVDELAGLLRVERKTAYAAVMRGEVPGVRRLGRCIRISRDAVMRWLADGEDTGRKRRRVAA